MEPPHAELLVVMAPAGACAVLSAAADPGALRSLFVRKVAKPFLEVLARREHVNTIIGVITNVMFIGPAVGFLYGSNGDALLDKRLGMIWSLFCGLLLVLLSRHAPGSREE